MGDGLSYGNWGVEIGEQRKKIQELEGEFLENHFKKKAKEISVELVEYLRMKKGSDSLGQKKILIYNSYLEGRIDFDGLKELFDFLEDYKLLII